MNCVPAPPPNAPMNAHPLLTPIFGEESLCSERSAHLKELISFFFFGGGTWFRFNAFARVDLRTRVVVAVTGEILLYTVWALRRCLLTLDFWVTGVSPPPRNGWPNALTGFNRVKENLAGSAPFLGKLSIPGGPTRANIQRFAFPKTFDTNRAYDNIFAYSATVNYNILFAKGSFNDSIIFYNIHAHYSDLWLSNDVLLLIWC